MELTLNQAERFVASNPRAKWNGWDLEIYTDQPNAFMRPNGAFINGRWCLKSTVTMNAKENYVVSKRTLASASRPWN